MPLNLIRNGLEVDLAGHRALGRFTFDTLSDLPDRGDAAPWVAQGIEEMADDWYVDDVQIASGQLPTARITARQPGYDWTWDGLSPVEHQGRYELVPSWYRLLASVFYGYWREFSNWTSSDNWVPGESDPLLGALKTWEVEFVATTDYSIWLGHANGSWPASLSPPAGTTAGIYHCTYMAVDREPWYDLVTGTKTVYYRHFAVFREAPMLDDTQLLWRAASWT